MQVINEGKKELRCSTAILEPSLACKLSLHQLPKPQVVPFELSPTVMLERQTRRLSYLVLYSSLSPFKKPISSCLLAEKFPFSKRSTKADLQRR